MTRSGPYRPWSRFRGTPASGRPPPAALTGRASKGVARLLRAHGFDVVAQPESFVVTGTVDGTNGTCPR